MSILQLVRPPVQATPRLRVLIPDEVVCDYVPTRADEAWLIAFDAARSGEPARNPRTLDDHELLRWCMGRSAGQRAREEDEAREIGRVAGLEETGASEPPSGYREHERAAYRQGYAEGVAEFEADREFEAWVASVEAEAGELIHAGYRISDMDIYPPGCAS